MNKSYVIEWKSQVNGRAGRGTKSFELKEAHRLAEELNREYPGIHHEPVEWESKVPEQAPPPEPASTEEAEVAPEVRGLNRSPDHAFSFE